jgi:hypothetical protein
MARASIRAIDGSGLRAGAAALLPTLLKVCKCALLSLVVGSSSIGSYCRIDDRFSGGVAFALPGN